jgi:hypothetical protein
MVGNLIILSYEMKGIAVWYDEVPDVAHEGFKVLDLVKHFFVDILESR